MRPDAPKVLIGVAAMLRTRVLPVVHDPFAQQTVNTSAGLLGMIAQEFDRAAARLVEENTAVRRLFALATDVAMAPELAEHLRAEAEPRISTDLRVSALQAENDHVRGLLIKLHAAVEPDDRPAIRELDRLIWEELAQSTKRRRFIR